MSFLGSVVGGVLGLFGSKKQKTETTSSVNYEQMVQSASAAGFNPLTALRNGGSAGFTSSTTTGPSTSSLAGALQSIGGPLGDALSDQFDPVAKKQRQLDTALVDYQLRQLKEGPRTSGTLYSGAQHIGTKVANSTPTMTGSKKGFIGPPMPEHLKLGVGKELPMYVWAVDDTGKRHRFPNPDLPDIDQLAVPSVGIVAAEAEEGAAKAPSWWDSVTYQARKRMNGALGSRYVVKPSPLRSGGGGW